MKSDFVHLHLHTEYSLLDGAIRISNMPKNDPKENIFLQAQEYKMPAIAITDHGNIFGAVEFFKNCSDYGIKPIIGCEVYVAPGSRLEKKASQGSETSNHFTLLVKNKEGYQNLCRLISLAYLEGFYYKPRIDKELLKAHSKGLIGLSGCLKGEIPCRILDGKLNDATNSANYFKEIFEENCFFMELQNNGLKEQEIVNKAMIEISKKNNIPVVATCDCHYLTKEDYFLHDLLLCISTGKLLSDKNRLRFETDQLYFKSPEEMKKDFQEVPEAIKNTISISERIGFDFDFNKIHLPDYQVPENYNLGSYLEEKCFIGLNKRFNNEIPANYRERLKYELTVIKEMGFSGYFLIVWDFVQYAKNNDIFVGFGRGSGAGSIVAYSLGITEVDPIRYDLIFERFLNKSRKTMPDLDIDFEDKARDKIIEYIRNRYGSNRVSHISTFQTIWAKNAIKDVGRVLGINAQETQKLANIVEKENHDDLLLRDLVKTSKELQKIKNSSDIYNQLFTYSEKLEGRKRNVGSHAAGIVITVEDITRSLPLAKTASDVIVTQYEGGFIGKLGVLKIDILGITNLSTVHDAFNEIKKTTGKELTLSGIPIDDKKTYDLISSGKTVGVFQLESTGMRDLLRKIKPENIEDIIATIALYRPGPMKSGMLDDYVLCKHGKKKIEYDTKKLEPILKETYGIILYQEQVMRVATDLAGFTAVKADDFRSSMSKKIAEVIEKLKQPFIEGVKKNGVTEKVAEEIFQKLSYFSGYGFNKSHSTAYALLSFVTAYLKTNYPLEYMTTLLTNQMQMEDKYLSYINELSEMGIELFPPDVNKSEMFFKIEEKETNSKYNKLNKAKSTFTSNKIIRIGLIAIKGIGEKAIESILNARKEGPFLSITDFCLRVNLRQVNRKVLEGLIKAGALDCFEKKRKAIFDNLDKIVFEIERTNKNANTNQLSFFNEAESNEMFKDVIDDNVKEWPEHILLSHEKEVMGFYLSGHPLVQHSNTIKLLKVDSLDEIKKSYDGAKIRAVGVISNLKKMKTKTGKQMAVVKLEDLIESIEVIFFEEAYGKNIDLLIDEAILVIEGKYTNAKNNCKIVANKVYKIEEAIEQLATSVIIKINTDGLDSDTIDKLKIELRRSPGPANVIFEIKSTKISGINSNKKLIIKTKLYVLLSIDLLKIIENMFGENSFDIGY